MGTQLLWEEFTRAAVQAHPPRFGEVVHVLEGGEHWAYSP